MSTYHFRAKWLSVACYELEKDGYHIVTDPCMTGNANTNCTTANIEGCDMMTLSHVHWDHITDIPELMKRFGQPPLLTGPQSALPLVYWADLYPQSVYPMDSNLELDFDWVKVKALFGRHVNFNKPASVLEHVLRRRPVVDRGMGDMQILGTLEYRNFLFTFPDGLKVLVWGNEFTPVQINIVKQLKPDIGILQATKQLKDPDGFVKFVKAGGFKKVLPHHMDLSHPFEEYIPDLQYLKERLLDECSCELIIPEAHGVWMEL